MSAPALNIRQRAQSQVSLRKKLVRTPSEDKNNELKKSSTMTSFRPKLERLIQEGKIQYILNSDPHSKANIFYTNHVNEMEKELSSTKKSLSTMVIKSKSKENSINTIKHDLKKVERQIDMIRQEASLVQKKFLGSKEDLENKKIENDLTLWSQKVYVNMKKRLYEDEVFLKVRYERLQNQYQRQSTSLKLLEDKYYQLKQTNKQLHNISKTANNISKEQVQQKNEFIELLEMEMSERQMLGELKADKYKKEGHINEIASSLIEKEELAKILQVLFAHRILSQIIKTKSNNLLKKYQHINKAYNHIKFNSNITETEKILKRMQDQDKLYDNALRRVNTLQQQLSTLESELQGKMVTKNEILSREGNNEKIKKGYYQGMQKDKYDLTLAEKQKYQQRALQNQVLRKNIELWAKRMFQHFQIKQNENNNLLDCLSDLVIKIRQKK